MHHVFVCEFRIAGQLRVGKPQSQHMSFGTCTSSVIKHFDMWHLMSIMHSSTYYSNACEDKLTKAYWPSFVRPLFLLENSIIRNSQLFNLFTILDSLDTLNKEELLV